MLGKGRTHARIALDAVGAVVRGDVHLRRPARLSHLDDALDGIAVLQEELAAEIDIQRAQRVDEIRTAHVAGGLPHGGIDDEERHDLAVDCGGGTEHGVVA